MNLKEKTARRKIACKLGDIQHNETAGAKVDYICIGYIDKDGDEIDSIDLCLTELPVLDLVSSNFVSAVKGTLQDALNN